MPPTSNGEKSIFPANSGCHTPLRQMRLSPYSPFKLKPTAICGLRPLMKSKYSAQVRITVSLRKRVHSCKTGSFTSFTSSGRLNTSQSFTTR